MSFVMETVMFAAEVVADAITDAAEITQKTPKREIVQTKLKKKNNIKNTMSLNEQGLGCAHP